MVRTFNLQFEDEILSTSADPLAAINVGVIDEDGGILEVITMEELARVGNSQSLNMHNYENLGEIECQFTISDADNISAKVAYLRDQQRLQKSRVVSETGNSSFNGAPCAN